MSVVIPARNAAGTLDAQLSALLESCDEHCEVIVVDNGSTDGTAALAAARPGVRLVHCPAPGASAARNRGVRAARGAKILFCDADDVVTEGWIAAMAAALDSYEIVGGPLDFSRLNDPFVQTTRINTWAHEIPLVFGFPIPVGGNFGIRRRVFDAIGGFDEAFAYGWEDTEFGYRACMRGFTVGFVPDAMVNYRLRATARSAGRQAAARDLGFALFRVKHGIAQPWKSKLLRSSQHARNVISIARCRSRAGRFDYVVDLAVAGAAVRAFLRYRIVP